MKYILVAIAGLFLAGCSLIEPVSTTNSKAACNTLKSKIVFNGATSVTRQADIQRAQASIQQQNYDQNCT